MRILRVEDLQLVVVAAVSLFTHTETYTDTHSRTHADRHTHTEHGVRCCLCHSQLNISIFMLLINAYATNKLPLQWQLPMLPKCAQVLHWTTLHATRSYQVTAPAPQAPSPSSFSLFCPEPLRHAGSIKAASLMQCAALCKHLFKALKFHLMQQSEQNLSK